TDKQRRRCWLERAFLVDVVTWILDVDSLNAALRPQQGFTSAQRQVRTAINRIAMRGRSRTFVEADTFPVNSLYDLNQLDFRSRTKAVESSQDFIVGEGRVLVNRHLFGGSAEMPSLVNFKTPR